VLQVRAETEQHVDRMPSDPPPTPLAEYDSGPWLY
jgi:hypothetical protein